MYRKEAIHLMRAVESEHRTAEVAVQRLISQAQSDPTILRDPGLEPADVRRCAAELEQTYLVRMFSVFEEHLRTMRTNSFHRTTHPPMRDLIQGCASHQSMPDDYLNNAHRVREYRNSIVHGGEADMVRLALAREYLCLFFSRMPPEW